MCVHVFDRTRVFFLVYVVFIRFSTYIFTCHNNYFNSYNYYNHGHLIPIVILLSSLTYGLQSTVRSTQYLCLNVTGNTLGRTHQSGPGGEKLLAE